MESHIAAAYAAEVGLPFAALRVISDRQPRPAIDGDGAIKPNGDIDLRRSCAVSRAIHSLCARWSRRGSTSIARCAACAAVETFCWAAKLVAADF
jgi:hypothetical protein